MLREFLLAIVLPPLLLLGWVAVQRAWRRHFLLSDVDGDALAARGGCSRCDCMNDCANPCDADSAADTTLRGRS